MSVMHVSPSTNASRMLPFKLAPIAINGEEPLWDGNNYQVGPRVIPVLEYGSSQQGWNDSLTTFHEHSAGDNHFIDVASRQHALSQCEKFVNSEYPVILEVGCSSGFMLRLLKEYNPGLTIGADVVQDPLEKLALTLPGTPLMRFDLQRCPLPDSCIDAFVALNVLEHIEDDQTALAQIYRILKPGGIAVLEVPAGPELFDNYDRALMHFRRYSMTSLKQKLLKVGFKIEYASHLGCFIYPAFWVVKRLNQLLRRAVKDDNQEVAKNIKQSGASKLLQLLTFLELKLGTKVSYPFGIRCLVTCSK